MDNELEIKRKYFSLMLNSIGGLIDDLCINDAGDEAVNLAVRLQKICRDKYIEKFNDFSH